MKRLILGFLCVGLLFAGVPGEGSLDVTTAGTAEALAASKPVFEVTVQCNDDNAGACYVGSQAVSSTTGIRLNPGDSYTFGPVGTALQHNLARIFIDVASDGDGVTYLYLSR